MNKYFLVGFCIALVLLVLLVGFGVKQSAGTLPDFWKSFIPNFWSNIIGVSLAAIIGVPVGFAINHYVVTVTERRHRERQVREVRQMLEQVRLELNLHLAALSRLSQIFMEVKMSPTTTAGMGPDLSALFLRETFGRQLIGNRSVLDIGESLMLFQVSNYYARVEELNRQISLRIQDTKRPEIWDQRIGGMTDSLFLARNQADYEIAQVVDRLTTEGN